MLCAAIDIGSNTTRLLVAEPEEGQLRKVMEQRAYTRIGKGASKNGKINAEKIAEVADVVKTQVRLAQEMGAETVKTVATAAIREAKNRDKVVEEIEEIAGVEVDVLDEEEEGRFAFIGATKSLGHPVDGKVAVVDVGGGSSEVIYGTVPDGVTEVKSFRIGSGSLTEDHLESDPPSAAEIRELRDHIADFFERPSSSIPTRRSRSAAAPPRSGPWSAPCSSTRRSSARSGCSPATRSTTSPSASSSTRVVSKLLPRRRAPAGEVLPDAGPAAPDRQGRAARGDHPRPAEREGATAPAREARRRVLLGLDRGRR